MAAASGPPSATAGSRARPLTVTERGALQGAAPAAAGAAARASTAIRAVRIVTSVATRGGHGGLRSYNPPPDGAPSGRPAAVLPRARGAGPRALARARRVPRVGPPPGGRRAVGLLGGPADRQRQAGRPPRPRARVQGHLPALQDDARLPGRAQGWLGHPRPARRDRRPAAAGDREQAGDRGVRDRRVQPALPRSRV